MKNHIRSRNPEQYNAPIMENNPIEVAPPFPSPYGGYQNPRMGVEMPQVSPGMGSPFQPNAYQRPATSIPQYMPQQTFTHPLDQNASTQSILVYLPTAGPQYYPQVAAAAAPIAAGFLPTATQHQYQNAQQPTRPPFTRPPSIYQPAQVFQPPRYNQAANPTQYYNYTNGSQMQVPPQTQQPPPPAKRERKPLQIVDPTTMQEVALSKDEPLASSRMESMTSEPPKPDNGELVRAEFASAIAARLGESAPIPDVAASAASPKNDQQVESDLMVPPPFIDTSVPPPAKSSEVTREQSPMVNGDLTTPTYVEEITTEPEEESSPAQPTAVSVPAPSPKVETTQAVPEGPVAVSPVPVAQEESLPVELPPNEASEAMEEEMPPHEVQAPEEEQPSAAPVVTEAIFTPEEVPVSTTVGMTPPASPVPVESAETPVSKEPSIKYNYREGMWSPANPQGKKRYDADFLKQIKDSPLAQVKPSIVPPEISVSGGSFKPAASFGPRKQNQPRYDPSAMDMFSPQYLRGQPQGGRHPLPQRPSQTKRPVINIPVAQTKVVLPKAENAWVPDSIAKKTLDDGEEAKTVALKKAVRSKLNKLTPQNFEKLSREIASMEVDTEARLSDMIQIFFDKAVDEPIYAPKYAEVCKLMTAKEVPSLVGGKVNFRKLLIDRCQATFEKEKKDEEEIIKRQKAVEEAESEDKRKELQIELDERIAKTKRITLGNIRFIGELYKLKMLTGRIMNFCISKLIKSKDEEQLECLCKLVSTIGKTYEEEYAFKVAQHEDQMSKKGGASQPPHLQIAKLEFYLEEMRKLSENKELSSRIRFMILDVLDLKKNNWVPRREGEKPKTIEEIHKELETERAMKQLSLMEESNRPMQNYPSQRRDRDDRRSDERKKSRGAMSDESGWQTPNVRKSSSLISQDQSSYRPPTRSSQDAGSREITFGPSGGRGWGRGSLGANNPPAVSTASRYAALMGDDDSGPSRPVENIRLGPPLRPPSFRGAATKSMGPTAANVEKQRALDAARNFALGRSRSQQASRESSLSRQTSQTTPIAEHGAAPSPVPSSGLKGKPSLNEDEIERKSKSLIDEYLNSCDLKEAVTCVTEVFHDRTIVQFIDYVINNVIEKKARAREDIGKLFRELIAKRLVSRETFVSGFKNILEGACDIIVDIPQLFENLAQIIVPALEQDALCLHAVRDMEKLVGEEITTRGRLGAAVLAELVKSKDRDTAAHAWQSSGLTWEAFGATSSDNVDLLISSKDLAFTKDSPGGQASCDSVTCPERKENRSKKPSSSSRMELARIFQDLSKDEATKWVGENISSEKRSSPAFIRDLVTVITELCLNGNVHNASLDPEAFSSWMEFLSKLINNVHELEMQALYAVQAIDHSRLHPKGFIAGIADIFYEKEVISEQAFRAWKDSPSPSEHEGHAICIKSLNQFFDWLDNAEEEDETSEKP